MADVNPETGESIVQDRSSRFTIWVALLIFSTVTMGSAIQVKNDQSNPSAAAKWAVTCSVVSFVISTLVVIAHLVPMANAIIVGTKIEGVMTIVLAAFWAATAAIVTKADNGLGIAQNATATSNTINNGNLYYGSWAGFISSIILLVNYLRAAFGVDLVGDIRNRSARLSLWAGLLASSLIVTGSSARTQNDYCSDSVFSAENADYCKRTKFAIADGTVSVLLAMAVVAIKMLTTSAPFRVEFGIAGLLAAMNAFAVAYITSPKGPGSGIGNLYYSVWITFILAAFLAADCFNQYNSAGRTSSSSDDKDGAGDIEVENLPDDQI